VIEHAVSLINSYFSEPHASLLNGILLGRKLFVTQSFYDELKEVGLIHIVVLSGMNITMLSAIILNTVIPIVGRMIATVVTIVLICGFIYLVGAEAPVVRAGIMGILALIGILLGRKTLTLWLLFLSGLIMVLINAEWLTSISFQLSFAATLGIILFGSGEEANDKKTAVLLNYLKEELRISLAAQVFTLPIIFWYFRQLSFISPIANILVAWMIAPIMILGMITIVLGTVSWQLGFVFSWMIYPLLGSIVWIVETLSKIPYASITL